MNFTEMVEANIITDKEFKKLTKTVRDYMAATQALVDNFDELTESEVDSKEYRKALKSREKLQVKFDRVNDELDSRLSELD